MREKISKTKLKMQLKRKTSSDLRNTISLALKNKNWNHIAKMLSTPTRNHATVNLTDIEIKTSVGDTVVIPGKVLSLGEISKKIRICALSFSSGALQKIKKTKSEIVSLAEEISKNPKAEGIKLIR
ncbi:50S ribosomal protein L18e [Candidatus Pacearchaeota archaeon]|nr:50S ribosomal protein L18e [Candidatus Pacearchaeota archaeon]